MQPHSPCILHIDDDRDSGELVRYMLQLSNADYRITCVLTVEEGLRLAATQRFDLYILDYRISGTSGLEICRTIRRTETDAPIMFFTAEAHAYERGEAMHAGADAYLVKPNDLKKLTETAQRLLSTRPKSDVASRRVSVEPHMLSFEKHSPSIGD